MASTLHCARSSRAITKQCTQNKWRETTLPAFLVPAFALPQHHAHFTTSSRCRSKIGRAPLSLPHEVTFRIFDAPPVRQARSSISRSEPSKQIEIQGPLGTMSLQIPPYIDITANEEGNTYGLNILDANDKKQKAMWGRHDLILQH